LPKIGLRALGRCVPPQSSQGFVFLPDRRYRHEPRHQRSQRLSRYFLNSAGFSFKELQPGSRRTISHNTSGPVPRAPPICVGANGWEATERGLALGGEGGCVGLHRARSSRCLIAAMGTASGTSSHSDCLRYFRNAVALSSNSSAISSRASPRRAIAMADPSNTA